MTEDFHNKSLCDNVSQYSEYYKCTSILPNQEKRREEFLQKQKEKRNETFDEKRSLNDLFQDDDELNTKNITDENKPKKKKKKTFVYKLMQSEWFTSIPQDLSEEWLVKLCPKGRRYLVVAERGKTLCYSKKDKGKPFFIFKSPLPGGTYETYNRFTVLDCIYHEECKIFFVFDVLSWNSLSLINSEAQMRFFWLKSKFDEIPDSIHYKYPLVLIDSILAFPSIIQDFLFTPYIAGDNNNIKFDGILFYHKKSLYNFGRTPLVGWLKTFMITEKLFIDVNPYHLDNKPINYVNAETFIIEQKSNKKKKTTSTTVLMEYDDI